MKISLKVSTVTISNNIIMLSNYINYNIMCGPFTLLVFLTAKEVMKIVVLPAFFPEVDDYDEL